MGYFDVAEPRYWTETFAGNDEQVEDLRTAVRKGRLFDVQQWIAEGEPLYRESSRKRQLPELIAA
jgi:hypothetical protein